MFAALCGLYVTVILRWSSGHIPSVVSLLYSARFIINIAHFHHVYMVGLAWLVSGSDLCSLQVAVFSVQFSVCLVWSVNLITFWLLITLTSYQQERVFRLSKSSYYLDYTSHSVSRAGFYCFYFRLCFENGLLDSCNPPLFPHDVKQYVPYVAIDATQYSIVPVFAGLLNINLYTCPLSPQLFPCPPHTWTMTSITPPRSKHPTLSGNIAKHNLIFIVSPF